MYIAVTSVLAPMLNNTFPTTIQIHLKFNSTKKTSPKNLLQNHLYYFEEKKKKKKKKQSLHKKNLLSKGSRKGSTTKEYVGKPYPIDLFSHTSTSTPKRQGSP